MRAAMVPQGLGFDTERLGKAYDLLRQAAAEGAFPGAVALVGRRGQVAAHWAVGHAQLEPEQRSVLPDAIFDLASLTKPVAGATAALLLLEDGRWSLDDAVTRFIPEFGQGDKGEVTIRHLLSHSAGFSGWVASYTNASDPEAALRVICDLDLGYAPGTDVQYSDVGFSVIGHLVRRVTGESIDQLLLRRVWEPLGMGDTGYNPTASSRHRIAATERGNRYEQALVRNLGASFDRWRDEVLVGQANDGNTYYALGGISSHAGLFSTAGDLWIFAQMYLNGGAVAGHRVLSPATITEATSNHTAGLARSRGLGWELLRKGRQAREEWAPSPARRRLFPDSDAGPAARPYGDLLSGRTYGHTGFTGTSLAIDPERELTIVLLTNRIHPDANNPGINSVRPRFHNLVAASLVD
ncbi:MAG: serine hydrolase domain-containing protein [Chloroflexota bacterium]